jgi:hypothetical protein
MPPDFLLRCTVCESESVWDTEVSPPVGTPEIGHPVLWRCEACNAERRHIIEDLFLIADKLHHEICIVTEIDRQTVDRVLTAMYRYRRARDGSTHPARVYPAEEAEEIARVTGVSRAIVEQVSATETAWLFRRGYIPGITRHT